MNFTREQSKTHTYKELINNVENWRGPGGWRQEMRSLAEQGGILSDEQITALVGIEPMAYSSPPGVISYGLSGYGYDLRVDNHFKVFTPGPHNIIVDPKNLDPRAFVDFIGDKCIIPPNSFALAVSVESFRIPRNVLAICLGKSSYARCGVVVPMTPLEPEWRGRVTLEISNTTPLPAVIYANEGLAQVIFLSTTSPCMKSYEDKKGRYQDQVDLTLPFVDKAPPSNPEVSDESHAKV